jgi:uncharacterized protein YndB with AHSA1/START domain
MTTQTIPAVRVSVTVNAPIEKAFRVFTEGFNTWWPAEHHIGDADMKEAVIEGRAGGRWYERGVDGSECDWGSVLTYDPPQRIVLSWHLNGEWRYDPDPSRASTVDVRFTDLGGGQTRVDFEHRDLDRHGPGGADIHKAVSGDGGWSGLLNRYAETAAS